MPAQPLQRAPHPHHARTHTRAVAPARLTRMPSRLRAPSRGHSPGGVIEHDLSQTEFDVVDEFLDEDEDEAVDEENIDPAKKRMGGGPMSPRRRWLQRQMAGDERASEASADGEVGEEGGACAKSVARGTPSNGWRARMAMKRVRQKAAGLMTSPLQLTSTVNVKAIDSTSSTPAGVRVHEAVWQEAVEEELELPKKGHPSRMERARKANAAKGRIITRSSMAPPAEAAVEEPTADAGKTEAAVDDGMFLVCRL